MNKKVRLICLIIAIAFIGVFLISIIFSFASAQEADNSGNRGETVYIDTDASGVPQSVISSVYISNPDGEQTITDSTTLSDIKVISGSDTFEIDGQNITFEDNGEDICYQGAASGKLPFSVSIEYYLDGVLTPPEEMAGKAGRVRIEIRSENHLLKEVATDDGGSMELCVPFSIICMLTLDDGFSAMQADGAKLSAQAGQITALSVLLPGLAQSLETQDGGRIKDSFYIEADTDCFELGSMIFIGMTGIVDENDLSGIDDIEGLITALDEINKASSELYAGSRKITSAMGQVKDGVLQYTQGVGEAADGTGKLSDAMNELKTGVGGFCGGMSTYASGVGEFSDKLNEAGSKLDEYTDPDAEVSDETTAIIESAIEEIISDNAQAIEEEMRAALDERLKSSIPNDTLRAQVIDAMIDEADLGNIDITIDNEQAKRVRNAVIATDEVQDMLAQIDALIAAGDELKKGADGLNAGASDIYVAIDKLATALVDLSDGMKLLSDKNTDLNKALASIARGSRTLTDGLRTLSEDGLESIVNETDKIGVSLSRKDALLALSEEYTSFSGETGRPGDTVQFMLTTQSIEVDEPIDEPMPDDGEAVVTGGDAPQENNGFIHRIGEWFKDLFDTVKSWFN